MSSNEPIAQPFDARQQCVNIAAPVSGLQVALPPHSDQIPHCPLPFVTGRAHLKATEGLESLQTSCEGLRVPLQTEFSMASMEEIPRRGYSFTWRALSVAHRCSLLFETLIRVDLLCANSSALCENLRSGPNRIRIRLVSNRFDSNAPSFAHACILFLEAYLSRARPLMYSYLNSSGILLENQLVSITVRLRHIRISKIASMGISFNRLLASTSIVLSSSNLSINPLIVRYF